MKLQQCYMSADRLTSDDRSYGIKCMYRFIIVAALSGVADHHLIDCDTADSVCSCPVV